MDSEDAKIFLKVAETESFTKTAQELYISQPSISKRMAALERAFGVPLFHRRMGKKVELTQQGVLLKETLNACGESMLEAKKRCRILKMEQRVKLRLGVGYGWDSWELYSGLNDYFNRKNVPVDIDIYLGSYARLEQKFLAGELDFIIIWEDSLTGFTCLKNSCFARLLSTEYVLVYSELLGISKEKPPKLYDFKASKVLVLQEDYDNNQGRFKKDIYGLGFVPDFLCVPDYNTLLMFLRAGEGYSIQDQLIQSKNISDLNYMPLGRQANVCVVWQKKFLPEVAAIVVKLMRALLARLI